MKVLIIIPAYNEEANIEQVVENLRLNCPQYDYIVVNDCSTDNTEEILLKNHIAHVILPVNLGIGGGVQTGYRYALEHNYDIAIQFDGDGQHDATYLRDLVTPIENGQADIVIGSRFIVKEGFQSSAFRRIGINFLSGLIYILSGVNIKDVTSGMRAVNCKMIREYSKNYAQDYPEPEAILNAGLMRARVLEVPVQMRERQGGSSSISPLKSVYYMTKVSMALLLSRISSSRRGPVE